jgi:uncharacterized membrane protein YfcA
MSVITWALLLAMLVILLASLIQGLVGFGFSLVSVPLLVLLMPATELVPMMVLLSLALGLLLLADLKRHVKLKRIWPLLVGGAVGNPLGILVLLLVEAVVIKLLIGALIVVFAVALLLDYRRRVEREKLAMAPVGLTSGVLNGSVSMSGPPVALFFANQGYGKKRFRASLIAYSVFLNVIALPFFLLAGLLTSDVLMNSGLMLPALVVGALAGSAAARKVREKRFRKFVLVLATAAGFLSLASGLGLL